MKARYVGATIGVMTLTSNKIYDILRVEEDMFRVVDDDPNEPEGYLYDPVNPGNVSGTVFGKWEIVEDDENGILRRTIDRLTTSAQN